MTPERPKRVEADSSMSEEELVARVRTGEPAAFGELVRRHMTGAISFSLRMAGNLGDAEEMAQDGFVAAFRALPRFRGESSFRSWLFQILLNLGRDRARRRRREEAHRQAATRNGAQASVPDEVDREMEGIVRAKIEGLPERQRDVLRLHLEHGMSYEEIGATLGISYDNVKMNLSLARKRMREELRGLGT